MLSLSNKSYRSNLFHLIVFLGLSSDSKSNLTLTITITTVFLHDLMYLVFLYFNNDILESSTVLDFRYTFRD